MDKPDLPTELRLPDFSYEIPPDYQPTPLDQTQGTVDGFYALDRLSRTIEQLIADAETAQQHGETEKANAIHSCLEDIIARIHRLAEEVAA